MQVEGIYTPVGTPEPKTIRIDLGDNAPAEEIA
jgi:hypothetical protein